MDTRRRGHEGVLVGVRGRNDGLVVQAQDVEPLGAARTHYRFAGVAGDHPVRLFMAAESFEEVVGTVLREGGSDWFVSARTNGEARRLADEPGRRTHGAFFALGTTGIEGFLRSPRFGRFVLVEGREGWSLDAVVSQRAAIYGAVFRAREVLERLPPSAPSP